MATHALIGIKNYGEAQTVTFCGLHYNGNPEEVFPALIKYKTVHAVTALIKKGRIIELESTVDENERKTFKLGKLPAVGKPSYFFEHQPFGHSYAWEEVSPRIMPLNSYLDMAPPEGVDDYEAMYYYLFDNKKREWTFTQLTGPIGAMYKEDMGANVYAQIRDNILEEAFFEECS